MSKASITAHGARSLTQSTIDRQVKSFKPLLGIEREIASQASRGYTQAVFSSPMAPFFRPGMETALRRAATTLRKRGFKVRVGPWGAQVNW